MRKTGVLAFLAAAFLAPGIAGAATFEQGMNTMWEALWHQSGTATRLVRWEQDLKVRVTGVNAAGRRPEALKALRDVAAETGRKVIDVTDQPDQAANVTIEITSNTALSDMQPCETRLNFRSETAIDSVSMKMRDGEVWRCAYHESMHVMGVRGHPEGDTVLSYFATTVDRLTPLDRAMLRAWYSPRVQGGMTPFEVLPVLADQLVATMPDKAKATQERDRFLAQTVQQMQAFAEGQGDIPLIIKRSGKATDQGIRYGRMEMSYFLAVAYERGVSVKRDTTQAAQWLQRAATMGSPSARAGLQAAA